MRDMDEEDEEEEGDREEGGSVLQNVVPGGRVGNKNGPGRIVFLLQSNSTTDAEFPPSCAR